MTTTPTGAYAKMARAFEIFASYDARGDVSAAHDEIYAGPDPTTVTPEHLAELETLGWHPCEYDTFRRFA